MSKKVTTDNCKQALAAYCVNSPGWLVNKYDPQQTRERYIAAIVESLAADPASWTRLDKHSSSFGVERYFQLKTSLSRLYLLADRADLEEMMADVTGSTCDNGVRIFELNVDSD